MKRNKNKKGFTIVELVIVIGVIGILSAILIPTFVNLTDKANKAALKSNLANAYSMYAADAADGTYEVLDNEGKPTGETYTIDFKAQEDVILSDGAATGTKYYTYKSHSTDAPVEWAEDNSVTLTGYHLVTYSGTKESPEYKTEESKFGGYYFYVK